MDALLYHRHPSLERAEQSLSHHTAEQREVLELLQPDTVGAELGVFAGAFSRVILEAVRPRVLHLVDPWWAAFGETYPDWGDYTDHGKLTTRAAHEAAVLRSDAARERCEVQVHVAGSQQWLASLPDESLDWAYLDTTHTFEDTLAELTLLARTVRADGLILGDDYWIDPAGWHYGVLRAVHAFVRSHPYQLIRADRHGQYALRREP